MFALYDVPVTAVAGDSDAVVMLNPEPAELIVIPSCAVAFRAVGEVESVTWTVKLKGPPEHELVGLPVIAPVD